MVPPGEAAFSITTTLKPFFNEVIAPTKPVPDPITAISVSPCQLILSSSSSGLFKPKSKPIPAIPKKLFKKNSLLFITSSNTKLIAINAC